jgi:MFS family permease
MIPGGKLTDRYGRKRLFMLGLIVPLFSRPWLLL